jgi:two-component sensor histidine kinase
VDETLSALARGKVAGQADLANAQATVQVQGIPLLADSQQVGALILVRDVTDLRHQQQALLSKDATIREIHHRVKNNLQTVAALLRLQSRRAASERPGPPWARPSCALPPSPWSTRPCPANPGDDVAFDKIVDRIIGLVRDLAGAYAGGGQPPNLVREGSGGLLPGEVATALAMCLSELLHNAVEHAQARQIIVSLARSAQAIDVEVSDDGRGLPDGFSVQGAGLGLQIVQSLANGRAAEGPSRSSQAPAGGTCARVRVPGPGPLRPGCGPAAGHCAASGAAFVLAQPAPDAGVLPLSPGPSAGTRR